MTSNIGARAITDKKALGFTNNGGKDESKKEYEEIKKEVMGILKKELRPEFINRIDEIIVFKKLAEEEIKQIINIMISQVLKRLQEKNINVEVTENLKDLIAKKGTDKAFGARPLRRTIQNLLEDTLAEGILEGKVNANQIATVDVEQEKVVIK
jgi:ATP-dependent Clp protease ATP-binding subunit ClpC